MRAYEYRHIIGFDETSLVGNVYYTNHVRWQGLCREMFLREHVPEILTALEEGFGLVTTHVSCEYVTELSAFDEIIIRMRLGALKQNRITMVFDYWRLTDGNEELVARGQQQVACMQRDGNQLVPIPVPPALQKALLSFSESEF